jgi:fructose-1,6-bisphosphatase/inositol monophosphatase family enzyme
MTIDNNLLEKSIAFWKRLVPTFWEIALDVKSNGKFNRYNKHGKDPVTEADLRISEHLIHRFNLEFGKSVILLTEESSCQFDRSSNDTRPIMIVDELDGTMNYRDGNENYSFMFALAQYDFSRNKHVLTTAMIYQPEISTTFFTADSKESFMVASDNSISKLEVSKGDIYVCGKSIVNSSGVKNASTFPKEHMNLYSSVVNTIHAFTSSQEEMSASINKHSCGIEVMDMAQGQVDAYVVSKVGNWDIAPSATILRGAGGKAFRLESLDDLSNRTDWELNLKHPSRYMPVLFTNGKIDDALFNVLKSFSQQYTAKK